MTQHEPTIPQDSQNSPQALDQEHGPDNLTPGAIVAHLDRYIVSQKAAKRCVANALRNRWRRARLTGAMKEEVVPKNILMVGPTGVGKTEIARRMARLISAPFIKVEATKFTEVGYVGRDVEQIIRDLAEVALESARKRLEKTVEQEAQSAVEQRILNALLGEGSSADTRASFLQRLRSGALDDQWIEVDVKTSRKGPSVEMPSGATMGVSMFHLGDLLKGFGESKKTKRLTVKEAGACLLEEERESLIDPDALNRHVVEAVEQSGIVFIDEIDKICEDARHGKVSREGVQRDLLPLLEGTSAPTKYGLIKTDHILFIASGAFHVSKPSDLLPELQGRLPIRVELEPLGEKDFVAILTEPSYNLLSQYQALMAVEGVTLTFSLSAITALARMAVHINMSVENIGARRLHTLLEKVLEDISFKGPELSGQSIVIEDKDVESSLASAMISPELSRFIL